VSGVGDIKQAMQVISHLERTQHELQQRPENALNQLAQRRLDEARLSLEKVALLKKKEAVEAVKEEYGRDQQRNNMDGSRDHSAEDGQALGEQTGKGLIDIII